MRGFGGRRNIGNLCIPLCWQTVEQQFIPALAIASAVSANVNKINKIIMKHQEITFRIDQLIQKGNQLLSNRNHYKNGNEYIDSSIYLGLKSSTLSIILKIYNKSHPFYTELDKMQNYDNPIVVESLIQILISIKEEITGSWLFTTKGLISAEIFANFLDMAEHLLQEKFKDASAIMIGSVLEEHLRQLCQKYDIEIEIVKENKKTFKKTEQMNSDLSSKAVYNKLDQKNITAWLDLRNKAAHGKYNDYSIDQVEIMYNGVSEFLTRNTL